MSKYVCIENLFYNLNLDLKKFKGFLYVNNNYLIVWDDENIGSLNMFAEVPSKGKFFNYFRPQGFDMISVSLKYGYAYLCYFIETTSNGLKFKIRDERVGAKDFITKYADDFFNYIPNSKVE